MDTIVQTELHRHLDISTRLSTLLELSQKKGLTPQSTSLESFKKEIYLTEPLSSLSEVLDRFFLFPKVLDRPEYCERIAYEAVYDCYNEGTRKVELRFSPGFVSHFGGLSWDDVTLFFNKGVKKAQSELKDIKVGLICIASRDLGAENVAQTVEHFLKHKEIFCALDLAGPEKEFPAHLFQSAFLPAIKNNSNITIHAGEASGPESVWEAIELLGAKRIGHGIHSIHDPKLLNYLKEKEICLEVCPTSNFLTQAVKTLKEHPLPELISAGIAVSINTDDPGIFPVTLTSEIETCKNVMGLNEININYCLNCADKYSFI